MTSIWVGFGSKFSNKGYFFGRFSLNMGGFFRKLAKKLPKFGSLPPKFIIEEGITATIGN